MRPPQLAPGQVEQAIFTWSSRNVTGVRGQSFGRVSRGLGTATAWLQAFDSSILQARAPHLHGWDDAYEDWKSFTAVCAVTISGGSGNINVVYRKIADGNVDHDGRRRTIAHCLFARSDTLDLGTVDVDDPHWLSGAECPLDDLPDLAPIAATELRPRNLAHDCHSYDHIASSALEALVDAGGTLELGDSAADEQLDKALLIALPVELWPQLNTDWYAGHHGATGWLSIGGAGDVAVLGTGRSHRVEAAGLSECAAHGKAEAVWATLSERTWHAYAAAIRRGPKPAAQPGKAAPPRENRPLVARQAAEWLVADAIGRRWVFDDPAGFDLDDAEIRRLLPALEKSAQPTGGSWPASLSANELWQLFSGTTTAATAKRAAAAFDSSQVPVSALLKGWRTAGLAVFGFALARRAHQEPGSVPEGWAIPRFVDPEEIGKLVSWAVAADSSYGLLTTLLAGGIGDQHHARTSFVDAARAAGVPSARLYRGVLVEADLKSKVLLDFVRDAPEAFVDACSLPHEYLAAFRDGLPSRRPRRLPSIRTRTPPPRRRRPGHAFGSDEPGPRDVDVPEAGSSSAGFSAAQ